MFSVGWWENPELLLKLGICSSISGSTWIGAARSHPGWFGLCCCAVPELFTEKLGFCIQICISKNEVVGGEEENKRLMLWKGWVLPGEDSKETALSQMIHFPLDKVSPGMDGQQSCLLSTVIHDSSTVP